MARTLEKLSLRQLQFSLAGITKDRETWISLEPTIPLSDQTNCIEALAKVADPLKQVQRMIVARRIAEKTHLRTRQQSISKKI